MIGNYSPTVSRRYTVAAIDCFWTNALPGMVGLDAEAKQGMRRRSAAVEPAGSIDGVFRKKQPIAVTTLAVRE